MKKILTLLLLFTLVGFLSANQVIITNDYQYIVSTGKTYNFNNGNPSNNVKYDRTNKIQIQNNKVIANPLKYHYAFFWQEDNTFIGYYKTNKGITTSGAYLGQVNTQSIPLPLNAYSFALVRYDNDYEVINGITIEDIFIDSDNYFDNTINWNILNNQTLNELFIDNQLLLNNNFLIDNNNDGLADNWITIGTLYVNTLNNGVQRVTYGTNTNNFITISQSITINTATTYYINSNVNTDIGNMALLFRNGVTGAIRNNFGTFNNSAVVTSTQTATTFQFYTDGSISPTRYIELSYVYLINLTSLGLTSLTQSQLDNFYNLFDNIKNNNFIYTGYSTNFVNPTFAFDNKLLNLTDIFGAGNEPNQATIEQYYDDYLDYLEYLYVCCNIFATQTISFETIYFDDGVSTEIERLGSILIFTLIGFTLMIFGFASKRRIFNLLAVGAFVVLGFLLIEFVGFIIILFGLIFVNVYYTFFGEL